MSRNREQNRYQNRVTGHTMNATEFYNYVKEQTEIKLGEAYKSMSIDEREACLISEFQSQLYFNYDCIN